MSFLAKRGVCYNPRMILKEFIFVVRKPDGELYEMSVPARSETDAERLLKNLLDAINLNDRIVSLKKIARQSIRNKS